QGEPRARGAGGAPGRGADPHRRRLRGPGPHAARQPRLRRRGVPAARRQRARRGGRGPRQRQRPGDPRDAGRRLALPAPAGPQGEGPLPRRVRGRGGGHLRRRGAGRSPHRPGGRALPARAAAGLPAGRRGVEPAGPPLGRGGVSMARFEARGDLVNGAFLPPEGEPLVSRDPATEGGDAVLETRASAERARLAAAAAAAAFPAWSALSLDQRWEALGGFRAALAERREAIAEAITLETGKIVGEAKAEAASLLA